MARRVAWLVVVLALGVVIAACGGTSKTASFPSTSSSVVATTTESTTTSIRVDYAAIYLGLVKPINAATDAFSAALLNLGNEATATKVQAAATPFADALTVFDSKVLRVAWPAPTAADVKGLVTVDGALIDDLESARDQTSVSAATSWSATLNGDETKASTASNIVRAGLGLPPPR